MKSAKKLELALKALPPELLATKEAQALQAELARLKAEEHSSQSIAPRSIAPRKRRPARSIAPKEDFLFRRLRRFLEETDAAKLRPWEAKMLIAERCERLAHKEPEYASLFRGFASRAMLWNEAELRRSLSHFLKSGGQFPPPRMTLLRK